MMKKNWLFLVISIACFNCFADSNDVTIINNSATTVTNPIASAPFVTSKNIQNKPVTIIGVLNTDLKKNAPSDYTVKKSDTVSKLATMYLNQISLWPQLLGVDNLVDTKLYPGDRLQVISVDSNRKILVVSIAGSSGNYYQKLSPTIRVDSLDSLPPIPFARIKNMLINPVVMKKESFEALPMVVGGSNPKATYFTMGDNIYVKKYNGSVGDNVVVITRFRDLVDPDTKEKLGSEYRLNATGVMTSIGLVSNLEPLSVTNQIMALDRVAPAEHALSDEIVPHKSNYTIDGKIIGLYDAMSATGANNTVVLNKGSRDGVEVGTVFNVTDGHSFVDPNSSDDDPKYLVAPEQMIGELLVYKVYDKVSFALITDSSQEIPLYSKVISQ